MKSRENNSGALKKTPKPVEGDMAATEISVTGWSTSDLASAFHAGTTISAPRHIRSAIRGNTLIRHSQICLSPAEYSKYCEFSYEILWSDVQFLTSEKKNITFSLVNSQSFKLYFCMWNTNCYIWSMYCQNSSYRRYCAICPKWPMMSILISQILISIGAGGYWSQ